MLAAVRGIDKSTGFKRLTGVFCTDCRCALQKTRRQGATRHACLCLFHCALVQVLQVNWLTLWRVPQTDPDLRL